MWCISISSIIFNIQNNIFLIPLKNEILSAMQMTQYTYVVQKTEISKFY